jgi:hypothetical protein
MAFDLSKLRVVCMRCPAVATLLLVEFEAWQDAVMVWCECHGEHLLAEVDGRRHRLRLQSLGRSQGQGRIRLPRQEPRTHRGVVGRVRVGAEGFVLDHLCRRRNCIALHHLEPVTQSENEKRKSWRYRARRATCPKGHGLAMNRAITPEGGVVCRQCNKEAEGRHGV